jgi:taurine dioxygenase
MQISRLTGTLGAEITGINVSGDMPAAAFDALKAALLKHGVIAIRDQTLTPAQQLAFVRRFGDIHFHPHVQGLPEQPEVMEILKTEAETTNFGSDWHTDQMFLDEPANYTCLYGLEIPASGGDTMFACMRHGYRTLSPAMQKLARSLKTLNRSVASQIAGRSGSNATTYASMRAKEAPADEKLAEHPLVRLHPETGEPSLYVGLHSISLSGFSEAESRPLIDYFINHMARPENTCRVRWAPGTLTIWDNRSVLHNAINDYHGQRRRMHRITVKGGATAAYQVAA